MYGGLLKSASALAIVAAAGLYGVSPAKAADLGGDCCADLEERVAELEATTARKGTRKVSLVVSGQISQQLMYWDDGVKKDVYISGPTASNSRWRFTGSAKISPEVSAGFLYEFEAFGSQSTSQNQTNGSGVPGLPAVGGAATTGDDAGASHTSLREALAWIEHSKLGRITIGHGSTAANNAILVDLSGKGMAASNDVRLHSAGFRLFSNTLGTYLVNGTWGGFFQGTSGDWLNERNEHIQYRTPTFAGFSLGASWGEDNYWDVEGRYSGEFNGVRIAGRLGYSVRSEYNGAAGALVCTTNCAKSLEQLAGSLSIRHMPTGLFFTGAAGWRDMTASTTLGGGGAGAVQVLGVANYDSSFFYLSGGIAKNWTGLGDTVLYGEYSEWKGNGQDTNFLYDASLIGGTTIGVPGQSSDKLTHWGVGIVQHIDAAAMEFWLAYKNYSMSGLSHDIFNFEDLHLFTAGTRIRF